MMKARDSESPRLREKLGHPVVDADGHLFEPIPVFKQHFIDFVPLSARLQPMFSSDIGHWDVPDMAKVLVEAHELVEDGHITDDDFRESTFTNPVKFYASTNPEFFKGTRVEAEATALLAAG